MTRLARRLLLVMLSIAAVFAVVPAGAVEPQTQEGIILLNKVSDGHGYVDNFVPSTVGEFTLIAGTDNLITLVQTLEYYWPLSRQIYASLDTMNRPVEATLRVSRDGKVIEDIAAGPVAIVYPDGADRPGGHVVSGDAVGKEFARFQAAVRDYRLATNAASQDQIRYEDELKAAAIARLRGEIAPQPRAPMAEPAPLRLLVTEPVRGYRLNLPAGRYRLDAIAGGRIVEGGGRDLVVIAADAAPGLVLDVVPEERWTRVLMSNSGDDAIFSAPGRTFYAVVQRADRFDHRQHQQLVNPQALGVAGREVWIRRAPATDKRLELAVDGKSWLPLTLAGYRVRQTRGADLGYAIEPAVAGETPEISAYAVPVPAEVPPGTTIMLRIVDAASGAVEPGSLRRVLLVAPLSPWRPYGLALLPLLFGVVLLLYRHRHTVFARRAVE